QSPLSFQIQTYHLWHWQQPPTSSFSKPSSSLPKWQIPTLLTEIKHNRSSSDPIHDPQIIANLSDDKENSEPNKMKNNNCKPDDKENVDSNIVVSKQPPIAKTRLKDRAWKPSSLQLCMQLNDPNPTFGSNFYEPIGSNKNNSGNIWDHSDSEAAPASSWSTLPNRSLLCRPLPEGQGRQNRKLAVAHHRRHNGRSEFIIAQNTKGILCCADDSYVGSVTANLMGSKYHIWDQIFPYNYAFTELNQFPFPQNSFVPTIATWTGSYRSMKIWLPKHQSMQLKNTTQVSKQYELDFRNRGKAAGLKIQSSAKNFQLTLEKNGRQTILQLGRIGKSKYVMDYRYPLTGYQAFSICLASIDSKLCCTM
ncbi:Tubby, C-terminal, partial [Cynara cardunculus var. scolymus]